MGGGGAWRVEGAASAPPRLVGMVRDEEGLAGGSPRLTARGVLSLAGKAVGQGSLDIFFLGGLQVFLLSAPGLQGRGLQGSAIREGQGPRLQQGALVDGVEVDGGLLLALASGEEGDPILGFSKVPSR